MRLNMPVFDANENIFLGRELESLDPREFMTLFAGLLARKFVPDVPNVDPTKESYAYTMYTITGQTGPAVPGKHGHDLPTVNVTRTKTSQNIVSLPASYQWTIDEIRAAAKAGVPLERTTVQAAMSIIQRAVDTMIATGSSADAIYGLLNNPSVDDTTAPVAKTGGGTAWSAASQPAEWISDINNLIAATRTRLQQAAAIDGSIPAVDKFVILLPQSHYTKLAETPRSTTSDTTALRWLLGNNPFIESIEEWYKCGTADGGSPRIVCYPRNEMILGGIVPIDFESLNPQEKGFDVIVPCRGKCGGVVMRYPVAVSYMDSV